MQGTDFGVIGGSGQLIQQGSGTLVLNGTNTYGGGTTIANGTLQLGAGGASGSITGNVTNNGTLVFNRSDDYTFGGVISGSGGLTNNGNIIRLSTAQTYTGPTQINSGIFLLPTTGGAGLSSSTALTVATGAIVDLSGRPQTVTGLSGGGLIYSFISNTGSLTPDIALGQTSIFSGVLGGALYPNFAYSKSGPGIQILSGANTFTGGATINGGILALSGANTYTGGTTINAGTLQIGTGGATGSITGNVTNNGTLIFNRSDDYTFGGVISGSGGLVKNGNILRLSAAQTYTGPTLINTGILLLPTTVNQGLSASTVVTLAAGSFLDLSSRTQKFAGLTGGGTVYSFNTSAGSLTLDVASGQTYTFSGAMGGTYPDFAFTKSGLGTQILSGANTYTGATTVNGGILILSSANTAGAITVNAGTLSLQNAAASTLNSVTIGNGALLSTDVASGVNQRNLAGNLTLTGGTLAGNSNVSDTTLGQFFLSNAGQQVIVSGDNQSTISAEMHMAGTHIFNVADGAAPVDLLVTGKLSHQHGTSWGGIKKTGNGTMYLASSMDGTNSAGTNGVYGLGGFELAGGTLIFSGSLGYSGLAPASKGGYFLADFSANSTLRWDTGNTKDISVNGNLRIRDGAIATFDTNGNDITFGTAIVNGAAGTGALTKTGAGTLTLPVANSYTGATTINMGTLLLGFGTVSSNILVERFRPRPRWRHARAQRHGHSDGKWIDHHRQNQQRDCAGNEPDPHARRADLGRHRLVPQLQYRRGRSQCQHRRHRQRKRSPHRSDRWGGHPSGIHGARRRRFRFGHGGHVQSRHPANHRTESAAAKWRDFQRCLHRKQ